MIRPRLFKSTDAGDHFSETPPPATSLTWPLAIAFSPTDHDTIFVGSNGVYRSTNGGQTWATLSQTHADNIILTFNANRVLLIGGDGGLYMSTSGNAIRPCTAACRSPSFIRLRRIRRRTAARRRHAGQRHGAVSRRARLVARHRWRRRRRGVRSHPQGMVLYAEIEWYFGPGGANVFQFYRCQCGGCTERSVGIDKTVDGPFIPRMAMDPSNRPRSGSPPHAVPDRRSLRQLDGCLAFGRGPAALLAGRRKRALLRERALFRRRGRRANNVPDGVRRNAQRRRVADDEPRRDVAKRRRHKAGPLPVRAVNDIVVDPLTIRPPTWRTRDSIRAGRVAVTCSARRIAARRGRTSPAACRTCR